MIWQEGFSSFEAKGFTGIGEVKTANFPWPAPKPFDTYLTWVGAVDLSCEGDFMTVFGVFTFCALDE